MTSSEPLILSDQEPFGVGGRRLCFVHPLDPARCVKVLRTDERRTVRLKVKRFRPAFLLREYDNNADERRELEAVARRIGAGEMSRHLPRCYGMAPTDRGPGLVLDLIRDADGGISRSIRELITNGLPIATLRPAFDALGAFLLERRIITRQLLDHNIAARQEEGGGWRLYIIDGFGDRNWLPLAGLLPAYDRRRIRRNLTEAWRRFEHIEATGGVSTALRHSSTWGQGILEHRGLPRS